MHKGAFWWGYVCSYIPAINEESSTQQLHCRVVPHYVIQAKHRSHLPEYHVKAVQKSKNIAGGNMHQLGTVAQRVITKDKSSRAWNCGNTHGQIKNVCCRNDRFKVALVQLTEQYSKSSTDSKFVCCYRCYHCWSHINILSKWYIQYVYEI